MYNLISKKDGTLQNVNKKRMQFIYNPYISENSIDNISNAETKNFRFPFEKYMPNLKLMPASFFQKSWAKGKKRQVNCVMPKNIQLYSQWNI